MSVEGGPSGATGIGVATGAPAMTGGPTNEGPFRGSLEGFRPMNITDKPINDKGGSTSPVSGLSAADAILEAEYIVRQSGVNTLTEKAAVKEAEHWLGITNPGNASTALARVEEQARVHPLASSIPKHQGQNEDIIEGSFRVLEESPETGSKVSSVLIHNTVYEQKNSSLVSKQAVVEVRQKDHGQVLRQEEIVKKRYLVDKIALSNRILSITQAVRKVKEVVGASKIPGKLINIFWSGERDPGNISQAVKPSSSDGSISEIREVLNVQVFDSEEDAKKGSIIPVESKQPVKEGGVTEDGEEAGEENVRRVFKFRLLKGYLPHETALQRTIRKTVSAPVLQNTPQRIENKLEDYPDLVEVFNG